MDCETHWIQNYAPEFRPSMKKMDKKQNLLDLKNLKTRFHTEDGIVNCMFSALVVFAAIELSYV